MTLLTDIEAPRLLMVLPSGDVLVSQAMKKPDETGEKSPNKISLIKMGDKANIEVVPFLEGLDLPFGMAIWENQFFVGEAKAVKVFPYDPETQSITGEGTLIAELPFPTPQRHWTRDLRISPDGSKLYVSVGSASNVGEDGDPLDPRTAAILEMNLDGTEERIYASGVRNAVTMAFHPETQTLWAVVNERDELGDDLVPDYLTAVQEEGFYGWPYAYWGPNEDPRRAGEAPEKVEATLTPDFSVGAHTAALGLTFTMGTALAEPFNQGALVTQHGSWNRSTLSGYQVLYVPFSEGMPEDGEHAFLTGFIADEPAGKVYGRPVSSVILEDGSVLVSDDGAGKIWMVSPAAPAEGAE